MKDLLKLLQQFATQSANRPEATDDLHERLLLLTADLGKLAHSVHWNEPKEKNQEHVTNLLILLLVYCVQNNVDVEKAIKDRLMKIPTLPMPIKAKGKARGLRL